MTLTDPEILELNELCNALIDGTLTAPQQNRLSQLLASSTAARQFYIRAMGLSASLHHYAGEMQADEMSVIQLPNSGMWSSPKYWLGGLALAASVVLMVWIGGPAKPTPVVVEPMAGEYVARLTASKDCQWVGHAVNPNNSLLSGQRLELAAGFAEITFDSGARVVLEGPASLEIDSAWDATLLRGNLTASVPPEAIGFTISNPSVEVVDLGTEFTMIAYANGAADVLVLKGAVEATSRETAAQQTIVLRENEARRFAADGVSSIRDSEEKFAHFNETVALDRFAPTTRYVHWSFDEAGGDVLKATERGLPLEAFNAQLQNEPGAAKTPARSEGRWQTALQLDGHRYARAAFPGISGSDPRTIVFWVKIPKDASLANAYALFAWDTTSKKLNSHPLHISWNRNPTEGTVGVLRTDYGGGFAIGATPLRDGQWHHVAVVFAPGQDEKTPVEVKQYLDGRLEGEGKASPRGVRKTPLAISGDDPSPQPDVVWFGRRLGHERQRQDRFRGELDEVFIADRVLEPGEIVQLMRDNQPAPVEVVTAIK